MNGFDITGGCGIQEIDLAAVDLHVVDISEIGGRPFEGHLLSRLLRGNVRFSIEL